MARRLVVARRLEELRRPADNAVEARDEEFALGHEQHAAPISLQGPARGRVQPAEAAAVDDRDVGRLAQIVQVDVVEFGDPFYDGLRRAHRTLRGARRGIWRGAADRSPGDRKSGGGGKRGAV